MLKKPSFSIIIGAYKQAYVLDKVLKSWDNQDYEGRYEVFLCDDCSDDNIEEVFNEFIKTKKSKVKFTLLRFPERNIELGCLSRNLNQALPYITGQYVFYCMGDTVPTKNVLSEMAKHVKRNLVLCAMRLNVNENLEMESVDWRYKDNEYLQSLDFVPIGHDYPFCAVTGNGLLVPSWAIKEIGGWNEEFVGWGEDDYDVCLRLYEKGLEFAHVPQVRIMHITHPITPPRKDSEKLWEKKFEEYKSRRRNSIKSITLDFDDFAPENNAFFYLKKLHEHFPLMKVSLFTIPFKMHDSQHVENWTLVPNLIKEINECDWIEILPHGFFHYQGEYTGMSYMQTKVAIAATEELFTKLGFNWKKIFRAPHWQFGDESLRAFRDAGYIVATNPVESLKMPRGLKEYQHNLGLSFCLPNKDELKLHGHIQNWAGTGIQENFIHLLELPTDKPWKFVSEVCEEQNGK